MGTQTRHLAKSVNDTIELSHHSAGQRVILAEYFCTDDRTFLFIVRDDFDAPEVHEIEVPLLDIRRFVDEHFREERDANSLLTSTADKVLRLDEAAFQEFFGPFIAPLASRSSRGGPVANEGDVVWLVPHDVLHYLPLHALKIDGRYLIDRNPVCYTPSASVMKYCQANRRERQDPALIFADSRADDPLPLTRVQAAILERILAPNVEVYVDGAATKTVVERRLAETHGEIGVLHLACHGAFNRGDALESGIMLAPEASAPDDLADTSNIGIAQDLEEEWRLSAREIFGLEIRAALVTLSACESGVNDRRPGDELFGLTRALIYAGAPSLIVSLWRVADVSTSLLMRAFYESWTAGASKAEALQRAQVQLRALTARDAITYCEEAKELVSDPDATALRRLLDWDIAKVREAAHDYEAAMAAYAELGDQAFPGSNEYRRIMRAISRCRLALLAPLPKDYDRRVYDALFHWAPFVLVGDWR